MVKVIWQKGCITAAHGWFSGIRQVAPMCIHPTHASLGPPKSTTQMASESVQPFLHSSLQSVVGHVLSHKNWAFVRKRSGDQSNTWFLGPTRVQIQNGISTGFLPFFAKLTAESCYTLQWATLSLLKNAPSLGDVDPMGCSLGPPKSSTQTASRSVEPFLQGSLLWQTDRQTMLLGQ